MEEFFERRMGHLGPRQLLRQLPFAAQSANVRQAERLCENSGFFTISRRSFSGVANLMVQLDQSAPKSGNFWHL